VTTEPASGVAADELDVTPAEGMAIIYALQPALAAGQARDPYFDRLFPDVADEIEVEPSSVGDDPSGDESSDDE